MMGPAYHPEWLVTFWLSTPVLNALNPHYLLVIISAGIMIWYFIRKKRGSNEFISGKEEQLFKHLLLRKNVIEEQLSGLEAKLKAAEITIEDYAKLFNDYQSHLEQVKKELKQYTL